MANFLVGLGPDGIEEGFWTLDQGDLVFGRDVYGSGAVQLPSGATDISKRHARIKKGLFGFVIEDLGSANGTLVNDRPVRRRALKNADEIKIGAFRWRVHFERPRTAASVEMVRGPLKGKDWEIPPGNLVVGRGSGASIAIPAEENTVSERHAAFQRAGGKCYVIDLGSKNGTKVNGRLGAKHVLSDGDRVQMGAVEFRVRIRSAGRRWLGLLGRR